MIIDRYFGTRLLVNTLLVLLTFLGIVVLLDLVNELGKVSGKHTAGMALYETLYSVTTHVYELLPAAVMIGALLSFGAMAQQSELLAARATGYSRQRIIFSALKTSVFFIVVMILLGETLIPFFENKRVASEAQQNEFQETSLNIWGKDGQNFIHAVRIDQDNVYYDVSIYEFSEEGNLLLITRADTMIVEKRQLRLNQVEVTEIEDNDIRTVNKESLIIPRTVEVEANTLQVMHPSRLNTARLIGYIRFLKESKLRSSVHELSLWQRISQPFAIIVMLLICMPFVFAHTRSSSTGRNLFLGIMIGLLYTIVDNGLSNWIIVSGWPAWLGAFSLPVVCLSGAIASLLYYR